MPSTLPEGDPAPSDGALPASAPTGSAPGRSGLYLHVPFCLTRCGYCDFNTYTSERARARARRRARTSTPRWPSCGWRGRVLGDVDLPVETIFVGGGTPTLLPPRGPDPPGRGRGRRSSGWRPARR